MSRTVFFLVVGWVLVSSAPLLAQQEAILGQIYGNGVHAYFGQDYLKAHQLLTSAIDGRTQDPRCFYFRGLTLLKMGRPQDAEIDFQQGAKLEKSIDAPRAYNVARSLERVQGSDRSTLEQYRLEARMAVLKKAEDEHRIKYEEGRKEQRDFLQKQSEGGPKTVEPAAKGTESVEVPGGDASKPAAPPDPFGDEGKAGAPKKEDAGDGANPVEPPKPDAIKPGPAKPDATKPEGDATGPFGDKKPDAMPADATKPDATKPEGNANGLFGDDKKPEAAKPDAIKPEAIKPEAAKPEATKPEGDANGLFGDDKKPVAAKPEAAKPDAIKPDAIKPDAAKPEGDANGLFGDDKKPDAAKPEAAKPAGGKPAGPAAPEPAATPFVDEAETGPAKKPAAAPADDKKPVDKKKQEKPADDKKPAVDDKKPAVDESPFG